ncbi:MAG: insulinase family protein [Actinomycetia bacterium]|nr:insulinase family protein [Actinomycetes bacterium]
MAPHPASRRRAGTTRTLQKHADGGLVRRTVLPGGLRVVTESVPTVRSVTFGIWAGVGSRDESPRQGGCSHYLEHLLFKGTQRRSALEISAALDSLGGEMNAFTTKEYTCFYARVLDTDLPVAVDVVSDLVTSSLLLPDDVENERGVILEEIAMHDDDPTDTVHDAFAEAVFGGTPLGRPVLGTAESIEGLSRATVAGYYRRHYEAPNLVVAAAGNLDHATVVRLVRTAFERAGALGTDADPRPPRAAGRPRHRRPGVHLVTRGTEQANLVLGMPGLPRSDERRFALGVLNAALGGGMSSRLFQEVREKRGLAYSVYSFHAQYADAGLFGVYAGCLPNRIDEVVELCRDELVKVVEHGISAEELARGQGQLRGSLVLGLEDTGSRMTRIGKGELLFDELLSVDQVLARIAAVTLDDVRAVAAQVLALPPTLAVVGPFDGDRDFAAVGVG